MSGLAVAHRLSCVLRFRDHFSGEPVADTLPVRIEGLLLEPVRGPVGLRQLDGTYRFLDVPDGVHRVLWRTPFARSEAGWTRWSDVDPEVTIPLSSPLEPVEVDLWPTAAAEPPIGALGVRGKLRGPDAAGATVRMEHQTVANDRFAVTDDHGEFLFVLPGAAPPDANGQVPLVLQVEAAGGAPLSVRPPGGGPAAPQVSFTIPPRTVARLQFELA